MLPGRTQAPMACLPAILLAGALCVLDVSLVVGQVPRDAREVMRAVEAETSYRFLYRDALVAGRTVSVSLVEDPVSEVVAALESLGLAVRVDPERRQILVFEARKPPSEPRAEVRVIGVVLDDATGARLPFATVSWIDDAGNLRGVASNEGGHFEMRLAAGVSEQITVSYVGYEATILRLDMDEGPREIAVRLAPRPFQGAEVVVAGTMIQTDLDTTFQHLIRPGVMAPLGESSVLRSLSALPSVSISAAMSDGLTVRGSKSDGFQVLLDGLPIYSRSHMFGLFDAFNEDALQTVAFYYGIAPASYQAPPGGTLSFLTRSGSQHAVAGAVGASNTSLRGTLEGPLFGGKGSWLVSGRRSYLDRVGWFGNDDLIAQGLDMGRETSLERAGTPRFEELVGAADYHDLHGKLFLDASGGGRFTLTGYWGADNTLQDAERRFRVRNGIGGIQARTSSSWGARAGGMQYQRPLGRAFLSVIGGATRYDAAYANTSLLGVATRGLDKPEVRFDQFENQNVLNQVRVAPEVTWQSAGLWSAGADLNLYSSEYMERNRGRGEFGLAGNAGQADAFLGWTSPDVADTRLTLGLRSHYYSWGDYLRFSPRAELRIGGSGPVSVTVGFSRNHQFIHQLEVQPVLESAPNVWILSSESESPGQVDYFTTGLYLRPARSLVVQVEAYLKEYENLRLHETGRPGDNASLAGELKNPWLTNVDGRARGVEVMVRHRTGPFLLSHSYAGARTVYMNPRVLDGREFLVSWDRTHQYTASVSWRWRGAEAGFTYFAATGTPNPLRFSSPHEAERLPSYHRVDAAIAWEKRLGRQVLSAGVSIFNLLDRRNVWYRSQVPTEVDGTLADLKIQATTPVDVYDLGLHPSLQLGIRF